MQMAAFWSRLVWGVIGDKVGRIQLLFVRSCSIRSQHLERLCGQMGDFGGLSVINLRLCALIAGFGLCPANRRRPSLWFRLLPGILAGFGTTIVVATASPAPSSAPWSTSSSAGAMRISRRRARAASAALRMSVANPVCSRRCRIAPTSPRQFSFMLFNWDRFKRYLNSILIGLPIWYSLGIVVTFSPEVTKALGITEAVTGVRFRVFWFYCGITVGSVANGLLSQLLRSRKLAVGSSLSATVILAWTESSIAFTTAAEFYTLVFASASAPRIGRWFCTVAAEQFGTNLHATLPLRCRNFVRGATCRWWRYSTI